MMGFSRKNLISIDYGEKKIYRTTKKGTDFLKRGKEFPEEIKPDSYSEDVVVIK